MSFVHDDPEFSDIVDAAAAEGPIASGAMVEKDYWICHSLWALSQSGLTFWFKGGTSLSKAFNLIERFSEDIDLVVLPGSIPNLPPVSSWKREAAGPNRARREFWEALLPALQVPGAEIVLDQQHDETFRNPAYQVRYPGRFVGMLSSEDSVLRPYVFLETSYGNNTRSAVAPSVSRPVTSAVHEWLAGRGQLQEFTDNRATAVDCVHPYVTLIRKARCHHTSLPPCGGSFRSGVLRSALRRRCPNHPCRGLASRHRVQPRGTRAHDVRGAPDPETGFTR